VLNDPLADKITQRSRADALLRLGTIFTECKAQKVCSDTAQDVKQRMQDAAQLVAERRMGADDERHTEAF